jgi:arsenical pump membrane protein
MPTHPPRLRPIVPSAVSETLAVLLLGATLVCAVVRPTELPEAVVAVPAAALLLLLGVLPLSQARAETRSLGATIGFLAAVLVLAELCDRHGLFEFAGRWMAAGSRGSPVTLLALVFAVASTVTAVLTLDATVVLLTPVVFATAARPRLHRARGRQCGGRGCRPARRGSRRRPVTPRPPQPGPRHPVCG